MLRPRRTTRLSVCIYQQDQDDVWRWLWQQLLSQLLNNLLFVVVVSFFQCFHPLPSFICRHSTPSNSPLISIFACSGRRKLNDSSRERWFNGEYDTSFGLASLGHSKQPYSTPIQVIDVSLHIFPSIGCIKTMSSDLESSRQALSIGCSINAKYRSFVNRFNSRGV